MNVAPLRLAIAALALAAGTALAQAPLAKYSASGEFDAVKEDLLLAIQGRGLVVDHTSYIGNMLERTGKDVGAAKRVYLKAEAVQFCSAIVSRRTMEADPANIAYCPYVIALYVLAQEPGTVYAVYRRMGATGEEATRAALRAVDELLDGIVREGLNLK